ncbi:hypothetical protein [Kitasatospora sp. NPDC008115]|uniref:hypothetical protein n=1 Tax=Kitasatospora sp. NPDC008115 TaxID=3364022 RepID=UPI0036F12367
MGQRNKKRHRPVQDRTDRKPKRQFRVTPDQLTTIATALITAATTVIAARYGTGPGTPQ